MRSYFGIDGSWVRPRPAEGWWRFDAALAAALTALSLFGVEAIRAVGGTSPPSHPRWLQYLVIGSAGALLVLRRRFPTAIMVALTGLHFLLVGLFLPEVVITLGSQILYFLALLSAFAWSQRRTDLVLWTGFVLAIMTGWLVWQFVAHNSFTTLTREPVSGLVSPFVASVLWASVVNLVYFVGAIVGGQALWHKARADALVAEQAGQLRHQATQLAGQAVLADRVRLSRELHDLVAHYISLIGVQAAAARRVLLKRPEAASESLEIIERASRDAVAEMRSILVTLRDSPEEDRSPIPDARAYERLFADSSASGMAVDYVLVDEQRQLDQLPTAVSASLYRITQEALSNARKHSTARSAKVALRLTPGRAELEVTDAGRPIPGRRGSGLGLQGIRERVAAVGGDSEIGPRPHGGFRVRVTLPWGVSR
ncbi:MAG: sensor histidine kinase [Propionibacteriaceae bacterium]|nr:sensor histidine kinase [Propionibacteriaceae bacterium]